MKTRIPVFLFFLVVGVISCATQIPDKPLKCFERVSVKQSITTQLEHISGIVQSNGRIKAVKVCNDTETVCRTLQWVQECGLSPGN